MPLAEDTMPVGGDEADEETKSVPGFGVMITLLAGFSAALIARRI